MKNLDIVADEEFGTGIPPEYLETNSPNNRRFIEEAYDAYNLTKKWLLKGQSISNKTILTFQI